MGFKRDPNGTVCADSAKIMYSKSAAKSMAKRQERTHGTNIQAYKCRWCNRWHVGKKRGQRPL